MLSFLISELREKQSAWTVLPLPLSAWPEALLTAMADELSHRRTSRGPYATKIRELVLHRCRYM